ncbi:transient receptor potential channel pyrexia-like isoform X2 [Symsagittifera roscoffensis]|uniref:transient receptor potential channel pyrexia-like isoform X2 n=1 Tax=Symsagittifera roscoffensis TaxID=84072 RepID=UPI00307C3478
MLEKSLNAREKMKEQQVANDAATAKTLQAVIPEIEKKVSKEKNNDVISFFQNILSQGIDTRDSFVTRHECLRFIQKVDSELYTFLLKKQGAFRDLDIFDRGGADDVGMTALMWAVLFDWEAASRILIDLGANGELTLNCERTLLMVAACRASPSVVELVADTYPKQLGATDINRDSVLVTTLTHNRHEVLETLLRTDQNVNELDYDAALMKAIDLGGRTKSGLLLVPKVKDVNAGPPRRTPYLYKAAIKGCLEIAEALIKAGAKVDKIKSSSGTNALMEASRQGHVEIVDLLLKSGAEPNLTSEWEEDSDTGYTSLHFAARFDNFNCIRLLLDHGADKHVESRNRQFTPYVIAIRFKAMESQKLLATGRCELPILLEAVNSKTTNSVDLLLSTSEHKQEHVNEALIQCCSKGYYDIAELLLNKYGANANSAQKGSTESSPGERLTCALLASMRGHLKVVELLFDHSANFQEQDKNGATAIHYVMACNAEAELIEKLVKTYGMSAFTKKDKKGRTPIYYANKKETLTNLLQLESDKFSHHWMTQTDYEASQGNLGEQARNLRVTSSTFPEAVVKFEDLGKIILDKTVQPVGYGPHDENLEVKVDFSFFYEQGTLTKKNELSEDVLQSLLDNDSPALQHPAIKLFLLKKFNGFPKWYARCQSNLYLFLALTFLTSTIIHVANNNQNQQNTTEKVLGKSCGIAAFVLTILCILFELLRLDEKGFKYFTLASSWFRLVTYIASVVAIVFNLFVKIDEDSELFDSLMRVTQCFVVLGLFFNLLLTLRRSAIYGIYVSIFCNVLENVCKLLVPIGLMILAFSASFYCVYQNSGQYSGMGNTGFKVISMMMGSVEPEEVVETISSNWPLFLAQTTLFILFLILMAIITTNLLIGIAISDVNAEIPLAKQTHLSQLTDHIVQSENVARAVPGLSRFCFKDKQCSISINQYESSRGIFGKIAKCFAPKSAPQFEQELIEELKIIVDEIYVQSTSD